MIRECVLEVLRTEPMYPAEISQALEQVLDDVRLCFSEGVLSWNAADLAMVCGVLREILAKFDGACLLRQPQLLDETAAPIPGLDSSLLRAVRAHICRAATTPPLVGTVCLVLGDPLPIAEMTRYTDLSAKMKLTVTTPGSSWASDAEILEAALVVICIDALWEGSDGASWADLVVPLPLGKESVALFARPICRRAALQLLHGLWLRALHGVASFLVLGPRSAGIQDTLFYSALHAIGCCSAVGCVSSWSHHSLQAPEGFAFAN